MNAHLAVDHNAAIATCSPLPSIPCCVCVQCLLDGVFTSKGDSWSMGVVLWEIVTFAAMPYVLGGFESGEEDGVGG